VNAQGDPNLADDRTSNLPDVHGVMRRMRAMADGYPGHRVLIGETYLPNTAELEKWYGGAQQDELQLPMDLLLGFHGNHDKLDATSFRQHIEEAETQLHGAMPLFVFDNHDNVRSIDRYADGQHDQEISKVLAAVLLTTRSTALMYQGEEIGQRTTTPTRREDVKDPIGITGWPKEKGRDGERTPMQWTPGPQAGFSTNPRTWLPIPPDYTTINVQTEGADPNSQLEWFEHLIALRRSNRALHDGGLTMLNVEDPNVLAYVRAIPKEQAGAGEPAAVVAINFTAEARTVTLDAKVHGVTGTQVKTLLTDAPSLQGTTSLEQVTLPPFAVWIGEVK
jgi:alpha-glucosidase